VTPIGLGTLAAGNLTVDSRTDLLVLSKGYANASAYYQDDQGKISQYSNITYPVDESPLKAIVDDSLPGHPGVFILCQGPTGASGSLCWFNTSAGLKGNADANVFSGSDRPMALSKGQLSNGHNILAETLTSSNKVRLYDENTNSTWTVSTQSGPICAVFGRFSSIAEDDLAVLNSNSHSISLYNGSQLKTNSWPYKNISLLISPSCLITKSLRSDGWNDLLIGYDQGCQILYNTEDGQSFNLISSENITSSTIGNRSNIVLGDFNNDGIQNDLAILNTTGNIVTIYARNASWVYRSNYQHTSNAWLIPSYGQMISLVAGNFGGSHGQDMAAITQNGKLLVFLQPLDGFVNGGFGPELPITTLTGKPSSMAVR